MKYVAAALAAASLLAGASAVAEEAPDTTMVVEGTAEREKIVLRVPTNVDLADPQAVRTLRKQATRTIEDVCNPGDRMNADMSPDWQCRREMAASLELALTRVAAPRLAAR